MQSSSSTMRLPRTKSALFKATSNKMQQSQLFSEMGILESDLNSTRKDLHAANVRTKSLTSVLKDKSGKVQVLEGRIAGHDDLLKVRSHSASSCILTIMSLHVTVVVTTAHQWLHLPDVTTAEACSCIPWLCPTHATTHAYVCVCVRVSTSCYSTPCCKHQSTVSVS